MKKIKNSAVTIFKKPSIFCVDLAKLKEGLVICPSKNSYTGVAYIGVLYAKTSITDVHLGYSFCGGNSKQRRTVARKLNRMIRTKYPDLLHTTRLF